MTDPLFVQGMRRSGTTILYDLLCADPELRCFYEPLAAGRPSVGGGSGIQHVDLFVDVRRLREEFAAQRPELGDLSVLNYGAPRDWRLEFEDDLPDVVRDYLRFLLAQAPAVAMKFTRMAHKIRVLGEVAPTARLVHIVRDPRAVAVSYLFGKGHRRREELSDPERLFADTSDWTQWSSRELSDHVVAPLALDPPPRDVERILALWHDSFVATLEGARDAYPDRYLMLRNEDLRARPGETLERLYSFLGRPVPPPVAALARRALRPTQTIVAADDPRWLAAYERLGMAEAVGRAGYLPHA